jgi:hypothetical protein
MGHARKGTLRAPRFGNSRVIRAFNTPATRTRTVAQPLAILLQRGFGVLVPVLASRSLCPSLSIPQALRALNFAAVSREDWKPKCSRIRVLDDGKSQYTWPLAQHLHSDLHIKLELPLVLRALCSFEGAEILRARLSQAASDGRRPDSISPAALLGSGWQAVLAPQGSPAHCQAPHAGNNRNAGKSSAFNFELEVHVFRVAHSEDRAPGARHFALLSP